MATLRRLLTEDRGQDLAEYAIAFAIITIGAALIANFIGTDVKTLWSNAQPKIRTVINAE